MTVTVIRGDARRLPLVDESVDLVVTSPPYFALRSYTDGGEHYAGQIGSESTPAEYIAALVDCTREWVRVLKPSGSLFVNLGDKYASQGGSQAQGAGQMAGRSIVTARAEAKRRGIGEKALREDAGFVRMGDWGIPNKSLTLLPERYRIACVDQLGLIARAVIVWAKPNGLPESVTDRVRRAHEDWVHLTKRPRYYSAVDEIREPTHRVGLTWGERKATGARTHAPDNGHMSGGPGMAANPLGKLPGSVWEIATEPLIVPQELGVDHFAAFPTEWPRRLILGWSPSGICTACGEGRRPIVTADPARAQGWALAQRGGRGWHGDGETSTRALGVTAAERDRRIVGEACACAEPAAPTRRAVVLDPFGGTGTTALVASVLGRIGISVDMSADYCRLAAWRTSDPGERARAMRVPKPDPVHEDQLSLWEAS